MENWGNGLHAEGAVTSHIQADVSAVSKCGLLRKVLPSRGH